MSGKYEIGVDHIRALAIQCHALDVQFDVLFNAPTICGATDAIYQMHRRLLSTKLLNLAISIRVSLAQEPKYTCVGDISPAAILELDGGVRSFSIRDICDKLIHAAHVYKPIEPGVRGGCWELSGRYRNQPWALGLSVQIFCEYMLRWMDELAARIPDQATPAFESPRGSEMSNDYRKWQDQVFDAIDMRRRLAEAQERDAALATEAKAVGLDLDKLVAFCAQQRRQGIDFTPEELIRFAIRQRSAG